MWTGTKYRGVLLKKTNLHEPPTRRGVSKIFLKREIPAVWLSVLISTPNGGSSVPLNCQGSQSKRAAAEVKKV